MSQPITQPPAGIHVPNGVRLFGVENIDAKATVTGALLFKISRLNVKPMSTLLIGKGLSDADIAKAPDVLCRTR